MSNNNLEQYDKNLNDIIYYYNKNMLEYHHNIENIVNLFIRDNNNNNSNENNRRNTPVNNINNRSNNTNNRRTNTNNSSHSNNILNRYLRRNNDNTYRSFYTFIPLSTTNNNTTNILSRLQIETATETIKYSNEMNETICPISFEDFIVDEDITKIKHCGHYFKTTSLMNWLVRSHFCPVCRYDLCSYVTPQEEEEVPEITETTETTEITEIDEIDETNTNRQTPRNEISSFLESIIRNIDNELSTSFDFSNNQFVAEYSVDIFDDNFHEVE